MTAELTLRHNTVLREKRAELATLREELASEVADLAQLRGQLRAFEGRYFRTVGVLYAECDELEARIAEREVALYQSDAARSRAQEAREQAEQTRAALSEAPPPEVQPDPSPDLKALYREVARRIHPDFARDPEEQAWFTALMARANFAYRTGDAPALQALLDDHHAIHAAIPDESAGAEQLRLTRQLQHVQRDLLALRHEKSTLLDGDIALLWRQAEEAARQHRDLLTELATSAQAQIDDARYRLQFVERQMYAHGR